MNWLDLVLLLILLGSIVTSFRKGLSREILGLVTVCVALLVGFWFYGLVGVHLLPYLNSRAVANFTGFAVVFCGVMLAGSLVSFIVGKFLRVTGLSFFDHLLGAGFGIVRGILVAAALVMGIMAFAQGERPPDVIVHSRVAPYVVEVSHAVVALAPHDLKEDFRKTYGRVKTAWEQGAKKVRGGSDGEKAENERPI
jgi:membrane protein required for colicin V production